MSSCDLRNDTNICDNPLGFDTHRLSVLVVLYACFQQDLHFADHSGLWNPVWASSLCEEPLQE